MRGSQQRKQQRRDGSSRRGAALLLTLIAIAIASLMAAGIAILVLAHSEHAHSDQDAARALDAAECGLNYQLQRIYATTDQTQVAYNGSNLESATYALAANPLPVQNKLYGGTASNLNSFLGLNTANSPADYCKAWIQYAADPTGTQPLDLTSSADLYITGQARVNGVTRTVRAKAGAGGLFQQWAIFGVQSINIGGNFSVTPTSGSTVGIVGSDGTINISKPQNVGGQIVYGTGSPSSGLPYSYGGRAVTLPTIDDLANAAYLAGGYTASLNNGIAKFSTANDNLAYGQVTSGGKTLVAMPTNGVLSGSLSYPIYLVGKGTTPDKVANYYLTSLNGSNVTILANVSNGPINLWVNNTSTGNAALDKIQGNINIVSYTALDASGNPVLNLQNSKLFHIYYSNQNGSMTFAGGGSTQNIYAMFYDYNLFNGVASGTINVTGTVTVNGAVYASAIGGTGSFAVNYPTNVSITDGAGIYFGLRSPWQEVTPIRGN